MLRHFTPYCGARPNRSAQYALCCFAEASRKIERNCTLKYLTIIQSLLFAVCITLSACSRAETQSPVLAQPSPSPSLTPKVEASPSPTPNSPIRSVDFENFTFPAKPIYTDGARYFTLKNGKYAGRLLDGAIEPYPVGLVDTVYGDVTGDGNEEAMLVFSMSVRGTAIPYYVYVYSMGRNKPKLLWSFATGDRAEGGLRLIYAENGNLVSEIYGKNKYVGGDYYSDSEGACCPSHYTRSRYEWRGVRFRRKEGLEVLSNPVGSAPYVLSSEQEGKRR